MRLLESIRATESEDIDVCCIWLWWCNALWLMHQTDNWSQVQIATRH